MANMTINPAEQRRGLRKSAVHEQICIVELGAERSAMLLDLSELGLGVQCVQGIPEEPTTSFRFLLPGSPTIVTGEGEIAWADSRGRMGIRFTNVAPEVRKEIRDWVNSEANPLFEDPVETEAIADEDARDRVAQMEARIMMSGWAQVQSLNFLVDQIAAMTQASGVAIAVEENGNGIVCKASSGIAPQVGVRINPRSGLSWECARTAAVVHCVDTETDPRVDRMVCRELNMRSAMLVPVIRNGRVTGLVEVFSSRPRAFSTNTIILLKRVAEAVGALDELSGLLDVEELLFPAPTQEQPKAAPVTPRISSPAPTAAAAQPALERPAAQIAAPLPVMPSAEPAVAGAPTAAKEVATNRPIEVPKPAAAPVARVTSEQVLPAPAVKPLDTAPVPVFAPAKPAPAKVPQAVPAVIKPAAQTAPAAVPQTVVPAPQPKPARVVEKAVARVEPPVPVVQKPAPTKQKTAPTPAMAAVATTPQSELFSEVTESRLPVRKIGIGIAAAVLLAAGAYEGAQRLTRTPAATPPAAQAAKPVQAPVQPPVMSAPPETVASATKQVPAALTTNAMTAAPLTHPAPRPPVKSATPSSAIDVAQPAAPLRVPIPPAAAAMSSDAPAPIPAPDTSGMANILAETAVVPMLGREEISRGVSGGKLVSRVEPTYPPNARSMRVSGRVVLHVHVSKQGRVASVDVVSGNPMLATAAVAAVRRWRYQPLLLNGVPIENVVTVQFNFNAQ